MEHDAREHDAHDADARKHDAHDARGQGERAEAARTREAKGGSEGEPGAGAAVRDARMNHEPPPDPNADPKPNRSTFLDVREVLDRARRSLRRVRPLLIEPMQGGGLGQRTTMFVDSLERQRLELESAIDRAVKEAPDLVLDTRVQYVVDPPWEDRFDSPVRSSSPDELTERVLACDAGVLATFRDLAERTAHSAAREFFAQLTGLLESHHQGLSRQLQAARDV